MNAQAGLIAFLVGGIILCAGASVYAWRNQHTRGRLLFVIASAAACFWMLGDVIGRLASSYEGKYVAELVRYFGVVNVPVWMFAFTREYCGKTVTRKQIGLLFIVPVISYIVMATSQWQPLFFTTMEPASYGMQMNYGPYFYWVHLPYCYALSILSIALVLNEMGRVPKQFRSQIFFLFVSLCVPFVINVLAVSGYLGNEYDTALSFPVFAIVLSIGIFRHRLLQVNPIAYENVFLNVHDGVVILSRDDFILDINNSAAQHTGKTRTEVIGTAFATAFAEYRELLPKIVGKHEIAEEFSHHREGARTYYSVNTANILGINSEYDGRIVTMRDITAFKQYQASLESLAYVDPLTRLPNRRRFQEEIEKTMQRAARRAETFAILYFDLDRFKAVNDTLGHSLGDELLKEVGYRTTSLLRAPDFVARLGGDEFVVLLHYALPTDLPVVIERLIEHVEQPFTTSGHTLTPKLSLGAACFPQDGDNLPELMRCADHAMYQVKAKSGDWPAIRA